MTLEETFVRLYDWARIWHRQAGGYTASDTSLFLISCDAFAHAIIDKNPNLECFRPTSQTTDQESHSDLHPVDKSEES